MSADQTIAKYAENHTDGGWVFVSRLAADSCVADLRAIAKPGVRISRMKRIVRADNKALPVYTVTVRRTEPTR